MAEDRVRTRHGGEGSARSTGSNPPRGCSRRHLRYRQAGNGVPPEAPPPRHPQSGVKAGPLAAGDRSGTELLTRITRDVRGYGSLRAEVLRTAWPPQCLHQRPGEQTGTGRRDGGARGRGGNRDDPRELLDPAPQPRGLLDRGGQLGIGGQRSFESPAHHVCDCFCLTKSPWPRPAKPPPPGSSDPCSTEGETEARGGEGTQPGRSGSPRAPHSQLGEPFPGSP